MLQIWDVSKISIVLPLYWRLVVTTLWAKQNILQHFAVSYPSSKSFCQSESKYRYNETNICNPLFCLYLSSISTTRGATSGAGTSYPSGPHEFVLPGLNEVRVTLSLFFCVVFCRSFLLLLSFFLLTILLSDLLRLTSSVYPSRICKPFYYNVQFIQKTNYNSKS
jgi:hypothetical protein